jgi:hypothetical protein
MIAPSDARVKMGFILFLPAADLSSIQRYPTAASLIVTARSTSRSGRSLSSEPSLDGLPNLDSKGQVFP